MHNVSIFDQFFFLPGSFDARLLGVVILCLRILLCVTAVMVVLALAVVMTTMTMCHATQEPQATPPLGSTPPRHFDHSAINNNSTLKSL